MCTRVLICAGVWALCFCHTCREISTFSILTIPIIYKSINISKEIITFPVFRIEALQKYQYFQGNINSFAVCRFDQTFWGAEAQVVFFCARRFFHTSNGFSMILRHVQCNKNGVVKNHCFYTGFISKMKSLAYFCLASWVGLKAPFVTLVLRHALKPQRGSKYYGETSLLAL